MQTISIIPSTEINTTKWDACVANNSNGLIYAYSYYLNHLVDHWHAVVVNDYELIFPIPHKKKLGIQYSYMPAFTQQLGFIGNIALINPTVVNAIQSFVQYASPYLNFSNQQFAVEHGCKEQKNYILNLHQPYESLKQHYQKTMGYSLSKAAKFNLQYNHSNNFEHAVEAYYDYNKNNMPHVTKTNYEQLKKLMHFLQDNHQLLVRTITNEQEEILSEVVLMKDNKRYYNIINVTTALGRKQEANYLLYDHLLEELSNQPLLFDFEGSDLTGVQKFYEKFGAINQPYFHWHYNLLPKPLQWLKK
jgi:hypothetical protein